jgi:P27 family predicted phage terminase small subunit
VRGRKPTPTNLRIIRGNPGKRALPVGEPQVEAGLPPAPRHLSPTARREWRRAGTLLARLGLVTAIDRALLASYCSAWSRLVDAEEKLREFGTIVKTPNGMLVQSPYLQIANKAIEQLAKIAPEFGMSPSSRTKVATASPSQEAVSKWDGLLG